MNKELVEEMKSEINEIPIIDGHEHIRKQINLTTEGVNLFTSLKYSIGWIDLISAGMPPKQWATNSADPKDDWEKIKPYMDSVQTTGCFTTLMSAYRDLYDFQDREITEENWEKLSHKISEAYQRKDWYEFVLKKKLNIEKILVDVLEDPGSLEMPGSLDLFIPTLAMDPFLRVRSNKFYCGDSVFNPGGGWFPSDPLGNLLEKWGVFFETFDEYLKLIDLAFEKLRGKKGAAIKFRFAYVRDMTISQVVKSQAEKIFYMDEEEITRQQAKQLEDYIVGVIIRKAIENNFPIQVHTGAPGDMGNFPQRGNPLQLTNLFLEYPRAKFILFHGSYPWTGEMAVLVKGYPNVYLDICWLPWLLHDTLKKYLSEWLVLIPSNKIMVAGDCETVERCYSAMSVAKNCFAQVLADYIEDGYYTKRMAINIAKKVFRENCQNIYHV